MTNFIIRHFLSIAVLMQGTVEGNRKITYFDRHYEKIIKFHRIGLKANLIEFVTFIE